MRPRFPLYFVLLALCWAACSNTSPATRNDGGEGHREPVTRTVEGFRIQVFTSAEKSEAEQALVDALQWLGDVPRAQRPVGMDAESVDIHWQQPYYRVRLGTFANREEAETALALVKPEFDKAFILPGRVTVTR